VPSSPTARQTPVDGVLRSRQRTQLALATSAAVLTAALTAVSFWLSYEHLHDVSTTHQLHGARAWAWPATIDSFIGIGELLILRASLMRRVDWWAIALTSVGSLGSIALNVSGVGTTASLLDYVVAAVPPVAALLAFAALMRQVHDFLVARQQASPTPVTVPQAPVQDLPEPEVEETAPEPQDEPLATPKREPVREPEQSTEPPTQREQIDVTVRALYDSLGNRRPATRHMRQALRDAGLPCSDGTCREARKRVEQAEPALRNLPDALAA
jgi:hypothetical protein